MFKINLGLQEKSELWDKKSQLPAYLSTYLSYLSIYLLIYSLIHPSIHPVLEMGFHFFFHLIHVFKNPVAKCPSYVTSQQWIHPLKLLSYSETSILNIIQ